MKKFLQTVLIAIMYLYIIVVTFLFIPYYNWNYAKTHGFMKWILFGEVVATTKAAIWPYYIFFSKPVNDYNSPDATHFSNSKKAFDEALLIVDKVGDVSKLPTDQKAEFSELLKLAMNEANQVQAQYLKDAHIDYPDMYKNKYIHGMSLMLQGIETDNTALILSGAFECNAFSDWIQLHRSEFSH